MHIPTAPNTVLWVEDDINGPIWGRMLKKYGYTAEVVPTVAEGLRSIEHLYDNHGKFHNILLLDMGVPIGEWPADTPLRIDGVRMKYPTINLVDVYRQRYGIEPIVGAFTGESQKHNRNIELEQELLDVGFRFLIEKAGKTGTFSDLPRMFNRLLTPLVEPVGMNILLGGPYASGKTNLSLYLNSMHRVVPTPPGEKTGSSPFILRKLSSNPHSKNRSITAKDSHNEAFYTPGLHKIRPQLQALDKEELIVHYINREGESYDYIYIVKKEGGKRLIDLLAHIDVEYYDKQLVSFEELMNLNIDFITSTANIEAASKIIEYCRDLKGCTLPVRMHIASSRLMKQFAGRERFSPETAEALGSEKFHYSTCASRRNMLLNLEQKSYEKALTHNEKLTDIGIKASELYHLNTRWESTFRHWYRFDVNDYFNEACRLEDKIMDMRRDARHD